jgi:Mrp family chromosome partitioning ATPase
VREPVAQTKSPAINLAASTLITHDVPYGWRPNVDLTAVHITALRDAVLQEASSRQLTIAVTGAAGTSRTQVAGALALALASSGVRVLLVEADFDRPELHQLLAISTPPGAGFSQQLMARRHPRSGQQPWVVVRCASNLHVLAEGRMRSPGLVASEEFGRAMAELREQHHVVLIHAATLSQPGELRAIGAITQGVVVASSTEAPSVSFGEDPMRAFI